MPQFMFWTKLYEPLGCCKGCPIADQETVPLAVFVEHFPSDLPKSSFHSLPFASVNVRSWKNRYILLVRFRRVMPGLSEIVSIISARDKPGRVFPFDSFEGHVAFSRLVEVAPLLRPCSSSKLHTPGPTAKK